MPVTQIDIVELRKIIREETIRAVKDSIDEELRWSIMKLFLQQVPCVSDEEQAEIEELCGKKPAPKKAVRSLFV
jgi:hypothetical protein